MLYLGWIVAAFLAGGIVSYALLHRQCAKSLQARLADVDGFSGRSYAQVLGLAKAKPQRMERLPDGRTLRVWVDGGYSIALLFDAGEVCLGVQDERMD